MRLIDEMKAVLEDGGFFDDIPALDAVETDVVGQGRWSYTEKTTYRRGDECVTVLEEFPATEEQEGGDFGVLEMFEAEPYEVTVTKYRRKTS